MRKNALCGLVGLVLAIGATARAQEAVKVGVLHSLSGTMAISETSLRDVVLMAVEEINAKGGVMGHKLQPVVVDPASNWPLFAEKAKQLIVQDKVAVTFGCWTSVSRKSVLPVFEAKYTKDQNPYGGGLLFYPVQYEGEEQSHNIFYTGASPNEQLIPAAEYMMGKEGGGKTKFYLLGTDYVFPRTANKVLKAFLLAKGVPAANIAEEYTPFGHSDYQTIVGKIKDFAKDGNACVLSTINGDSNVPFYKEFANQGLTADKCPIMAFSVAEDELRSMETEKLVGHLAAWNYYQSQETPENKVFVTAFKKYAASHRLPGGDARVTDDPMEAAYFGVYVWKAAVEKAGSFDTEKVIAAVSGIEFDAPGGKKKMDTLNHHTWKPVLIGSIKADGQFDIIWKTPGLVHPDSYSTYLHTPDELKKLTGAM
ncbi:MAG TPA: urea ABC transporter substrate-binding protein [Humisphaera sp.]|jgi:urea transport system substrate-binding protein|nr:urea ABC transporter substrate-binding protein [Humisphaera sp.]